MLAIVVMLGGLLALRSLSISQYPQIAPTTVRISATYPGADAQTVENSVTKVIEQGMTGIDNLDYITATSSSTGQSQITLTFTSAANPDTAQIQVQNKLQLVTRLLPQIVQNTGVSVTKSSTGFLMVIAFVSTDRRLTSTDLADFVASSVNDTLRRVAGVGDTQLFGSGYAMRVWLDPDKLARFSLMPSDVSAAISAQNTQVSAGQLGGLPSRPASSSTPPSPRRAGCRPPSSSAPSSSRAGRTARSFGSATSRPSSAGRRATTRPRATTAFRPPGSPSTSRPARTPSTRRRACRPHRGTEADLSARGSRWSTPTTPRRSCGSPSRTW